MTFGQPQPTEEIIPGTEQQTENLPVKIETESLAPTPEQVEAFKEEKVTEINNETDLFAGRGVEKFNNEILSLGFTDSEPLLEEGKKLLSPFEDKAQKLAALFAEKLKGFGVTGAIAGTILGGLTGSPEQAQGATPASGETVKTYEDKEQYEDALQAYNDSLQLHEKSIQRLEQERQRVSKNIDDFSPIGSLSNTITSLGNLFSGDREGSHRTTPKYSEESDYYNGSSEEVMLSGKIKPIEEHIIGDPDFIRNYNIPGVIESRKEEILAAIKQKEKERMDTHMKMVAASREGRGEEAFALVQKRDQLGREEDELRKNLYGEYYSNVKTFKKPVIKPEFAGVPDASVETPTAPAIKKRPDLTLEEMPIISPELTSDIPELPPEKLPDANVDIMNDDEKFVPYSGSGYGNPNIPLGYWDKGMGDKQTQERDEGIPSNASPDSLGSK